MLKKIYSLTHGQGTYFRHASLLVAFGFLFAGCVSRPPTPTAANAAQALLGEWEAILLGGSRAPDLDGVHRIIFISESEAWLISRDNKAYKSRYWQNPNAQPMQIDIVAVPLGVWMTTYRFKDFDTLQILPRQTGLQEMRHPGVETNGAIFRRQPSQSTQPPSLNPSLPPGVTVQAATAPDTAIQEAIANQYLNTLIFAQRDYFQAKRSFAPQLSDLNPGFTPDFVGYRYQTAVWEGRNVIVSAQPTSPGLRSLSAILATGEGESSAITTCRSRQPSLAAPTFLRLGDQPYVCAENAEPSP